MSNAMLGTSSISERAVFGLVIPSFDGTHLLVSKDGSTELSLPTVTTCPEEFEIPHIDFWCTQLNFLSPMVNKLLGTKTVYLRRHLWAKRINGYAKVVLIVDLQVPSCKEYEPPSGMKWMAITEAAKFRWVSPHSACILPENLLKFFHDEQEERQKSQSDRFPIWRQYSWISRHVHWLTETLNKCGLKFTTPSSPMESIKQVRNRACSTVLECSAVSKTCQKDPDPCEIVWLFSKVSQPYDNEGVITATICRTMPRVVPPLLYSSTNSYLQLGALEFNGYPAPADLLTAVADFQIGSIPFLSRLRGAGVPDLSPQWILTNLNSNILHHNALCKMVDNDKLNLLAIRNRTDEVDKLCTILNNACIPLTLVHGDIDLSNVLEEMLISSKRVISEASKREGLTATEILWDGMRFIDWSDCCISHPFLDFIRLTRTGWEAIKDEDAIKAYLNRWLTYSDEPSIKLASIAARPLMYLVNLYQITRAYDSADNCFERDCYVETLTDRLGDILNVLDNTIQSLQSLGAW